MHTPKPNVRCFPSTAPISWDALYQVETLSWASGAVTTLLMALRITTSINGVLSPRLGCGGSGGGLSTLRSDDLRRLNGAAAIPAAISLNNANATAAAGLPGPKQEEAVPMMPYNRLQQILTEASTPFNAGMACFGNVMLLTSGLAWSSRWWDGNTAATAWSWQQRYMMYNCLCFSMASAMLGIGALIADPMFRNTGTTFLFICFFFKVRYCLGSQLAILACTATVLLCYTNYTSYTTMHVIHTIMWALLDSLPEKKKGKSLIKIP